MLKAIGGLFYNAFIKAYQMRVEDIIDFTSVTADDKDKASAESSDKDADPDKQKNH